MRLAVYVLLALCLSASAQEPKGKNQPRVFNIACFYKAGDFLEVGEADRVVYVSGLMDGFYASPLFGARDEAIASLTSCTRGMDSKQLSAIVTKYVKEHPEGWHLALNVEAYNALDAACPGGLRGH
jgi:hypothetical protein